MDHPVFYITVFVQFKPPPHPPPPNTPILLLSGLAKKQGIGETAVQGVTYNLEKPLTYLGLIKN